MRGLTEALALRARALVEAGNSPTKAAKILGVPRRMVFREVGRPLKKATPEIRLPMDMTRAEVRDAPYKHAQREARSATQGKLVWPSKIAKAAQAMVVDGKTVYRVYLTPKAREEMKRRLKDEAAGN